MNKKKLNIYLNAPITLGFVIICTIVLVLDYITKGITTHLFFSTYHSSFLNPLTYVRLIGHVFGHANITHLISNMTYILLLGPMLEEKYKNKLIYVIIISALATGLINNIFSPNTILLGASGVCFSFILLSSITGTKEGVPVTLIIVAILWIGGEIYSGIAVADNISQISHIIGGLIGAFMGMKFKSND